MVHAELMRNNARPSAILTAFDVAAATLYNIIILYLLFYFVMEFHTFFIHFTESITGVIN